MRLRAALAVALLTSCSPSTKHSTSHDPPAGAPPASCDAPALLQDVSSPTAVVGDGTAASCTREALQRAADKGGVIVFSCGSPVATISISSTVVFKKETILDGGGLITLSGESSARILYFDSAYDVTTPRLTVQRLTFRNGNSPRSSSDDTAVGGGAIYRDGGSLTVTDCTFIDNAAPSSGQDVAGGAIYGFGGGETVIVGSTFAYNQASNGGAVGSLNGDLTIVNSSFTENAATGSGGNPGDGGCGGAVYMDGGHERTILCGATLSKNRAGAIGGGFFRVSNDHSGAFTMNRSTVDSNQVTASNEGNAGGLYLEGLDLTMANSTISRNQAYHNGGIWISAGQVQMTNVTIAENTALGTNGGGIWVSYDPPGTLLNCTIANNHLATDWTVGAGIFDTGTGKNLVLQNTVVANNTANVPRGCNLPYAGSGDLQFPAGALCTASPLVADPLIGLLADNGGPTETMLPGAASPARGLGTGCPPTDQRGEARHEPCTAGAVEVP